MKQAFLYDVVIEGMNHVPLRTTKQGAIDLLAAFHKKIATAQKIVSELRIGEPYKNDNLTITRRTGMKKPTPMPNPRKLVAKR